MAKLSKTEVLKLAQLARLELSNDEIEQFQLELSEILGYVDKLKKVKVNGLKPTYQVTGLSSVMREDKIVEYGTSPEQLLTNAPMLEGNQIKVKRVL